MGLQCEQRHQFGRAFHQDSFVARLSWTSMTLRYASFGNRSAVLLIILVLLPKFQPPVNDVESPSDCTPYPCFCLFRACLVENTGNIEGVRGKPVLGWNSYHDLLPLVFRPGPLASGSLMVPFLRNPNLPPSFPFWNPLPPSIPFWTFPLLESQPSPSFPFWNPLLSL